MTRATNSSRGTEALERHFPAGLGAPLTAVVKAEEAPAVTREMEGLDSVQLVLPTPAPGDAAEAVIVLVLHQDPYGSDAEAAVEEIRERLHAAAPDGLLGGEAAVRGTREGVLAALTGTGGVIAGAGLILAGTFATLTLLPLEELVQVGATVAVGVLLDTFLVRALLIPAITYRLGDRAWWPSTSRTASNFRSERQEI